MDVQVMSKGLRSEYRVEKDLPKIITDKEKLIEVLINLINNSVKYTPAGKITVSVWRDADMLHFSVKDTGIGISKADQKKLFQRFYQVDSSFTRKASGAGLGLAICREFIELMGGNIWVKSQKDMGSEFHFTLPVKPPVRRAAKNLNMPALRKRTVAAKFK
jgi:signal transduction histidine kinase